LWPQQQQQQQQQQGLQQQPPRVKLTGEGKMPVADLRNMSIIIPSQPQQQQQPQQPQQPQQQPNYQNILPPNPQMKQQQLKAPKSPVYAVVNKTAKMNYTMDHNYCNIVPDQQQQ